MTPAAAPQAAEAPEPGAETSADVKAAIARLNRSRGALVLVLRAPAAPPSATEAALELLRSHPWRAVLGAAALGALTVAVRPWRWRWQALVALGRPVVGPLVGPVLGPFMRETLRPLLVARLVDDLGAGAWRAALGAAAAAVSALLGPAEGADEPADHVGQGPQPAAPVSERQADDR